MVRSSLLCLGAFVLALVLCALSRPALAADAEGGAGLVDDVERLVASEEAAGWFADAEAFRSIDGPLLESVCRATPEARAQALESLRLARARAGDARELFRASGTLTDEAEHALTVERRARALERALERVAAECPFWVRGEPGFPGLQSDRRRFTLSLESGGNIQLRRTQGDWSFGGGGLGRILPGYGLDGRHSLLFGAEFGGGAMIRPGTSASQFVINYFPAVPLVLRTRLLTWHYDVETAPVAVFQADDTRLSFGFRVGGSIGFTALRKRDFLPWAGLALAYEYYFPGARPYAHFIRGGLRFGIQWDP